MPWVATTSFETTDGTASPVDGNDLLGTGDGSGWSATWADGGLGAGWDYDSGIAEAGSWSVITSTNAELLRNITTAVVSGIVKVSMRSSAKNGTFAFLLFVPGVGSKYIISLTAGGDITLTGTTVVTLLTNYTLDTWNVIHMSFDGSTAKARLAADSAWSATVNSNAAGDVGRVRLEMSGITAGTRSFDNIAEGSEPSAAAVTLPSNLPLLKVG